MIGWSAVGRVAVVAGILGGAAWWLHGTWSASGYRDGYREGYAAAMKLATAESLALASEVRAEAAEKARAKEHDYRETERRQRAEIEAGRLDAETRADVARADRDRLVARLRVAEDRLRAAARGSGVPEAAGAEPAGGAGPDELRDAIAALGGSVRSAVEGLGDAAVTAVWYQQCRRDYRTISRTD